MSSSAAVQAPTVAAGDATRLRIGFLIRSLGTGGAERQLVVLAAALANRHDVSVAVFYGGSPAEETLTRAGVRVRSLEKRGRWDIAGFGHRLRRWAREERLDVLHSYLVDANFLAALAVGGMDRPRLVWGVRSGDKSGIPQPLAGRASLLATRLLGRRVALIVANSHSGALYHARLGYPSDRMRVVHNGVEMGRFRPSPEARVRLRQEWSIPAGAPTIGIVGRVEPVKDHGLFLEAAAAFRMSHADARFVIVGRAFGDHAESLRRRCGELGLDTAVIWVGERPDAAEAYSVFDVATLVSRSEGFPNAVVEALACEVPCVVTDVGDAAAAVDDPAMVVRTRRPEDVAEAWGRALSNYGGVSERAALRRRVQARYRLEALVDATEALLREVATGGKDG